MKKLYYLIVLTLILGLVLTGCFLSNVGQVPASEQSGVVSLTKGPSPDLVGLWHFDGNAGDSSGVIPPNNGIVYGAKIYEDPGLMGKALSFNGMNDYVLVPDHSTLDITGAITIEAWIKAPTGQTNGDIFDDSWHHVALTYDGINMRLYIDGELDTTKAWTGTILTNENDLYFGCRTSATYLFTGTIDEVRIWSVALPQSQLGDITPPEVNITAPDEGGCYRTDTLPELAKDVEETNPYTVDVTNWSKAEGVHTVTVTATDDAGNIGSDSVTYTVDNTDPVVTITDPVDGVFYAIGSVPDLEYMVTDNLDLAPVVNDTGYSTDPGVHTVTVTATDCAGNEGSDSVTYYVLENFVTGGGKINKSNGKGGKKVTWTFDGTVGNLEEGSVAQFQLVDHTSKIAYHCNNNFSALVFSGEPTQSPMATHNTAVFTGTFIGNDGSEEVVTVTIEDLGEPGAGVDWITLDGPIIILNRTLISGGNFQVHDIDNEN